MSPVADRFNVPAVIVPAVCVIAFAAVKLMMPPAEKLESTTMSLPAPVTVTLIFGAVMLAPLVVMVPPAVRSNNVPADDAASVTPDDSVRKTLAPVVLADRFVTSVKI